MLQAAAKGCSPARRRTSFEVGSGHPTVDRGRLPEAGDPAAPPGTDPHLTAFLVRTLPLCLSALPMPQPVPAGTAGKSPAAAQQVPGCLPRCTTELWGAHVAGVRGKNLLIWQLASNDLWRGYG